MLAMLPATFDVRGTSDPTPVTVRAVGYEGGEARVERDAVTPIPEGQVGELRLALDFLCIGTARSDDSGNVTSTCPSGQTCVNGSCKSSLAPAAVVQPSAAGAPSDDAGVSSEGCFDVTTCYTPASAAQVDTTTCVVMIPAGTDPDRVNIGLKFPAGTTGVCDDDACYVSLTGWTDDGSEVDLPPAAWRDAATQGGTIVLTTACNRETEGQAVCGSWSSVTMKAREPPAATMPPFVAKSCGDPTTQACGQCGTETRTCTNGVLGAWGACTGEGVSKPGSTQKCGTGGTQTCTDGCRWGACTCSNDVLTCGAPGTCASPGAVETCGGCDNDCTSLPNVAPGNIACAKGHCAYDCTEGFADCDHSGTGCSTDLSAPATCGSCTNDCTNLAHVSGATSCNDGKCAFPAASCAGGWGDCNGEPSDGCETELDTMDHCGACGTACSGATAICDASVSPAACASTCAKSLCGMSCVDTQTSANHCGACETACPAPAHGQAACTAGKCDVTCDSGYTACSGACVDTTSDAHGCGACGKACASGWCQGGKCACTGATSQSCGNCGTQTRSCNSDGTWSAWSACTQAPGACAPSATQACEVNGSRTCGPSCTWGSCACMPGFSLCGGTCVDEQSDATNCGACGHACAQGIACLNGVCQCTPPAPSLRDVQHRHPEQHLQRRRYREHVRVHRRRESPDRCRALRQLHQRLRQRRHVSERRVRLHDPRAEALRQLQHGLGNGHLQRRWIDRLVGVHRRHELDDRTVRNLQWRMRAHARACARTELLSRVRFHLHVWRSPDRA